MIVGIGTDIAETSRFKEKLNRSSFLQTVFTEQERSYCLSKAHPEQHLAARFAAKESYMKALGTGWSEHASFNEIEIIHDSEGAPKINLLGASKRYFDKSELKDIFVSLSHIAEYAVAYVMITK